MKLTDELPADGLLVGFFKEVMNGLLVAALATIGAVVAAFIWTAAAPSDGELHAACTDDMLFTAGVWRFIGFAAVLALGISCSRLVLLTAESHVIFRRVTRTVTGVAVAWCVATFIAFMAIVLGCGY